MESFILFCSSHWYLAIICFPYLDGIVYAQSNKPSAEDNLVSSTTSEDSQVQQVSGSGILYKHI